MLNAKTIPLPRHSWDFESAEAVAVAVLYVTWMYLHTRNFPSEPE